MQVLHKPICWLSVTQATERVRQTLKALDLECEELDDDILVVRFGVPHKFRIYVSPNDLRYFHTRPKRDKRLHSSEHYVVVVEAETTVEELAENIQRYIDELRLGKESEDIAGEALKQAMQRRPNLFADGRKTLDSADIAGSDFRVGLYTPTSSRIFWIGFEIKSSVAARSATIERYSKQARGAKHSSEEWYPRRVIAVPQDGTREERIDVTAQRMIEEAQGILDRISRER